MTGRVLLDDRPLPDVQVVLAPPAGDRPLGLGAEEMLARLPHRAVSDGTGAYRIPGVPSGQYAVFLLFPTRAPAAGGSAVVPVSASVSPGAPTGSEEAKQESRLVVKVEKAPVTLPPLRFARAVGSRSFGELDPAEGGLPLEWDPWPGTAAYQVRVVPAPWMEGAFDHRVPAQRRDDFHHNPVLWTSGKVTGPRALVPLLSLAPDHPAQALRFVQYQVHGRTRWTRRARPWRRAWGPWDGSTSRQRPG